MVVLVIEPTRRISVGGVSSVVCLVFALLGCWSALFAEGRFHLRFDMVLWAVVASSAGVAAVFARNWVARFAFLIALALAAYLIYGRTVFLGDSLDGESHYLGEVYLAPLLVLVSGIASCLAVPSRWDSRRE